MKQLGRWETIITQETDYAPYTSAVWVDIVMMFIIKHCILWIWSISGYNKYKWSDDLLQKIHAGRFALPLPQNRIYIIHT